ncbi:MAG: IS630 family transposase [Verrucomicrobiae bacterium]|nr:IS630 family transposase [Verrucomicrobiae bacterium]
MLLIGTPNDLVVRNSRMSPRTLRLWVRRFNEMGIDGLIRRPGAGRPRILEPEEIEAKVLPVVDDPALAGQTHWTARKLCGWLNETLNAELSYRTVVRYLHEHDDKRKIPRPMPKPPDPEVWEKRRESFFQELLELLDDRDSHEVFFEHEAGFEGDPRPRQKWVKRGSRPTQEYYGGHIRQNVVGAVNPSDGQLVSLIVSHNNREVFQAFLDTMAREVPDRGKTIWLVLDNASWHRAKSLDWHHIRPLFLPPTARTSIRLNAFGNISKATIWPASSPRSPKRSRTNWRSRSEISSIVQINFNPSVAPTANNGRKIWQWVYYVRQTVPWRMQKKKQRQRLTEVVITESAEIPSIIPNDDGSLSIVDGEGRAAPKNGFSAPKLENSAPSQSNSVPNSRRN